jgi:HSP20 family protein
MFETEKEIMVIVEIAGVPEKEINILLDRDFLIIRGSRRESLTQFQKRQYHKMEIDYGPFERVIKLPSLVETEGIEATMKDGFLMIRLKKTETRNPPKEITIE